MLVSKLDYLCYDFDACIFDIFTSSLHLNFRGALAFIIKGKRDTTLSYLVMSIVMLLMFMLHATYYF